MNKRVFEHLAELVPSCLNSVMVCSKIIMCLLILILLFNFSYFDIIWSFKLFEASIKRSCSACFNLKLSSFQIALKLKIFDRLSNNFYFISNYIFDFDSFGKVIYFFK